LPNVDATGTELLNTLGAVLVSKEHAEIMLRGVRNFEWMQAPHTPKDRRSECALHPHRAERERVKKGMATADPREISVALLRALRELSDGPPALRLGVIEREKQASSTEELWQSVDMPLQRGGRRHRGTRLFVISSKYMMSNVIVPGPTAAIRTHRRPDEAVLEALVDIRKAVPDARIVGVDVDDFDQRVGHLRRQLGLMDVGDSSVPFTLRLPGLLQQNQAPVGPMAMILPVNAATGSVEIIGHLARDLRGLRAGRRGTWLLPRKTMVEDGDEQGMLFTRPVIASVTEPVRVCLAPGRLSSGFPARIVRIAHDVKADIIELSAQALLVCVLGVEDPDLAIDLAIATVSATDTHPRIANYLKRREGAKVFAGEGRTLEVLDIDRATAAIGFAAYQLDHPELETTRVT
jgi:hypothetical protein